MFSHLCAIIADFFHFNRHQHHLGQFFSLYISYYFEITVSILSIKITLIQMKINFVSILWQIINYILANLPQLSFHGTNSIHRRNNNVCGYSCFAKSSVNKHEHSKIGSICKLFIIVVFVMCNSKQQRESGFSFDLFLKPDDVNSSRKTDALYFTQHL